MKYSHNGHIIELFDSIETLPYERHILFGLYALIDSGIGSDASAVLEHVKTVRKYITRNDLKRADKELAILEQSISFVINGVSPELLSFCTLIKSFNNKPFTDLSESGILEMTEIIKKRVRVGFIKSTLNTLKKKFKHEFEHFFPDLVSSGYVKEYYALYKKQIILKNKKILGEDVTEELDKVNNQIFDLYEPDEYSGKNGAEVRHKKKHENICAVVRQHAKMPQPKKMTTFEVYQAYSIIKSQNNGNKGKRSLQRRRGVR